MLIGGIFLDMICIFYFFLVFSGNFSFLNEFFYSAKLKGVYEVFELKIILILFLSF